MNAPKARPGTWVAPLSPWVALLVAVMLCATAMADEDGQLSGMALVIGQSDYEHLDPLTNPENDARKIEELLDGLGFETEIRLDRTARRLRRDLDGFVEDAEGTDVALVYYSGHGIEAGGQNYLLPTDTDVASLARADTDLVALSDLVQRLMTAAKIAIVLVDACRTNPFPSGTLLRTSSGPEGFELGDGGLGTPKGAFTAGTRPDTGSLGVVIGFAAEPGRIALDGAPETSSPYAAALLKHLTVRGHDFADVMTLVTEEVYLKTRAQQRPWTNASLRRFLIFRPEPEEIFGDEVRLRGARRNLLLTIASTPLEKRRFVEDLARRDRLPLDALFGMLNKFESADAAGPGELEHLLHEVASLLRQAMRPANADFPDDTEFARYSELADRAIAEGAIDLAREYRREASNRAEQLSRQLDASEQQLRDKRLQLAAAFAKDAQEAAFTFDHKTSSDMYGRAYREVRRWDEGLAYLYKRSEAERLRDHGRFKGDSDALRDAIGIYKQALSHVRREANPGDWSKIWNEVGETYSILGERGAGFETLRKAIEAFNKALEVRTREAMPQRWAGTHDHLGTTYLIMGQRETGKTSLLRAAASYETALDYLTRHNNPMHWAGVINNLGTARAILGQREKEANNLERAVRLFESALSERRRERVPLEWAATMDNLGAILTVLGTRRGDRRLLRRAAAVHEAALEELARERVPVVWAQVTSNLGNALAALGALDGDTAMLTKAIATYRAALIAQTYERDRFARAHTLEQFAQTLLRLGALNRSREELLEGKHALAAAWDIFKRAGDLKYDDYFAWRLRRFEETLKALE